MKFRNIFEKAPLDKIVKDRIDIVQMLRGLESDVVSEDKKDFKRAIELVKPENVLINLPEATLYEASEKTLKQMVTKISKSFEDLMTVKNAKTDVDNMADALSILFTVKYKSLDSQFDKTIEKIQPVQENMNEAKYKNKRPFLYPKVAALKGTLWGMFITMGIALQSVPDMASIDSAGWATIITGGVVLGVLNYVWTKIKMWFYDYPSRGRRSGGHFFEAVSSIEVNEASKELIKIRKDISQKLKKAYKG